MPTQMLQELIDQNVTIYVEGELGGFQETILCVEGAWLKVQTKKNMRFVNGDMITQIIRAN